MARLACAATQFRRAGWDDFFLTGLSIAAHQPRGAVIGPPVFAGLVHAPELPYPDDIAPPISEVTLVDEPAEYTDPYEFEPPLEMTGSVIMRLQQCELPDIEWDY